jgi:hypothetical protein
VRLDALAKEHGVTLETILERKSAHGGTAPGQVRRRATEILEALADNEQRSIDDEELRES